MRGIHILNANSAVPAAVTNISAPAVTTAAKTAEETVTTEITVRNAAIAIRKTTHSARTAACVWNVP